VTASGSHANGPVDNIKQVDGFWNSGHNGCVSEMYVVWDLQTELRINGVRYKGIAGESPTDFLVYTSGSSSGPWNPVYDNEGAGDGTANEQTFLFSTEPVARYWRVVIQAPFCSVVYYWQWHGASVPVTTSPTTAPTAIPTASPTVGRE
jgi:hypothetical protein